MKWLKNLFIKQKEDSNIPPIPPHEEIVKSLYDKGLSCSSELAVVRVLYSTDMTKRFILLHSNKGFYKYTYEEICVFDTDEWKYICNAKDAYPAFWESKDCTIAHSLWGTEEEARAGLIAEEKYKAYFL